MKNKLLVICLMLILTCTIYGCGRNIVKGIPPESAVEGFAYNNKEYSMQDLYIADNDKTYMGVTEQYHSSVYFVGNKSNPDIIIVQGSDNTGIFKSSDFKIQHKGDISKVLIDPGVRQSNDIVLIEKTDIDMILRLMALEGNTQEYSVSNYYTQGNSFYLEYNGCLVSDYENIGGYIAKTGEGWVFVNKDNLSKIKDLGNNAAVFDGILIHDNEIIKWIDSSHISKCIE